MAVNLTAKTTDLSLWTAGSDGKKRGNDVVGSFGAVSGNWQYAAGYYDVADMEPVIVHPRPDAETSATDQHRLSPANEAFKTLIVVQGGSAPFNHQITSGQTGLGIDDEGVITWVNPPAGTHTITGYVRTQDYGRQPTGRTDAEWGEVEFSFDLVIASEKDTTKFVYMGAAGNDANDGSFSSPIASFEQAFSGIYGARQLRVLDGTYNTDGTSQYQMDANNPRVMVPVDGHSPVINYTQKNFVFGAEGCFVGAFNTTEGGYGLITNNERLFVLDGSANRWGFYGLTVTDPSNGTEGTDNCTTIFSSGAGAGRNYGFVSHCTETGRASSTNSAGLFVLFRANYVVSQYNYVNGSAQYNTAWKDSNVRISQRFDKIITGGTGRALTTGCQLQAYPSEHIEIKFCTTDAAARLNWQAVDTAGVHYFRRNTVKNVVTAFGVDDIEVNGPYYISDCAIEGSISDKTNVVVTGAECVASSGVLDSELKLIDPYRTDWLGQRGAERVAA